MDRANFDALVANVVKETADLLVRKGAEYAGDGDRLANFKRNAAKNEQTILECWQTYWGKHVDSINSFISRVKLQAVALALSKLMTERDHGAMIGLADAVRLRELTDECLPEAIEIVCVKLSEPIEGRFIDNINYSYLGMAIIKELKG